MQPFTLSVKTGRIVGQSGCCNIRPEQPNPFYFVHWNLDPSSEFFTIVSFRTSFAQNIKPRDHILRILPPPAPAFGTSRATQAPRLPRPDILGTPGTVLRRSGRPRPDPGTRPGRARLQPYRPHVHRRPLRRHPL